MAKDFLVENLPLAIQELMYPSIGAFNRLEGRPRTSELGPAMRADVRDGVWFLTRQWQLGEFQAEDRGSAVTVRYHAERSPVVSYSTGPDGAVVDHDGTVPLEARVEQRPVPVGSGADAPLSLDVRLSAGRRLLARLDPLGPAVTEGFLTEWCLPAPGAGEAGASVHAHPDSARYLAAAARRALDGWAVLEAFRDPTAALAAAGVAAPQRPAVLAVVDAWAAWLTASLLQPVPGTDGWRPERLAYGFEVATGPGEGQHLTGAGYAGGHLDWFDADLAPKALPDAATARPEVIARTVIPVGASFPGMPNARWWTFEDARTDVGSMSVSSTDLGRLLLTEFALIYSNDWLVQPLTVGDDGLLDVKGVVVTDSFGRAFWLDPAGRGDDDDWQRWSMYTLSRRAADGAADQRVFLPPTAQHIQEGPVLEEVALVRDEMANLVWGIEARVPLANGRSVPGAEAAADTRAWFERLAATAPSSVPPDAVAPVRYRVMSDVPEHWIPFVAVHTPGSDRDVRLQRAALPRMIDGGPQPAPLVRPRTSVLQGEAGQRYFLDEEEVPRSGTRVTLRYQRARWYDGRVVVWLANGVEVGRGEASSNLRFDQLTAPDAPTM